MFHFPKKRSKLSLALKTVLVSYFDWGLGFKYFRGAELIHLDSLDNIGSKIGEAEEKYTFGQGNITEGSLFTKTSNCLKPFSLITRSESTWIIAFYSPQTSTVGLQ